MQEISYEMWTNFKNEHLVETRNYILVNYLELVKKTASRLAFTYQNHFEIDDLCSYGILGLMDAIEKFDIDKGIKFETYATFRIKGSIIDNIRKQDWLPKSLRQKFKTVEEAFKIVEKNIGKYPDDQEVANYLGISASEVRKILSDSYSYQIISMDEQIMDIMDKDDISVGSDSSPENKFIENELKQKLVKSIDKLTENEKMVISLYYFEELNQKEISRVMGLTESRVSQLHSKAILKIKASIVKEDYI